MEEYEGISVIDVYDIVTDFAKEFRPIVEIYGAEPLNNIMSKVITILEHLEAQTLTIGKLNSLLQEREATITKLEKDKAEKAADRQRFEKELEQIEEHWKEDSHEMVSMISRLQEENKKLVKSLEEKQDFSTAYSCQALSTEVDIIALQKSRASIDKLRDQLKIKEKDVNSKIAEIECLADQVERLSGLNKDLRKKYKISQNQIRNLIDERADFIAQLQNCDYELSRLKQGTGITEERKKSLPKADHPEEKFERNFEGSADFNETHTAADLKNLLVERNELKTRIMELEEELKRWKQNQEENQIVKEENDDIITEEEEEDAPVQGPLPYEPSDAPWRKSESGIRKLFRKLFNETNLTFMGSSPKRSLSSLSKMTLSATPASTCQ